MEWYHADKIMKWENSTESVSVLVSTSDPKQSQLNVTFTAFKKRQFSMHVTIKGNKADTRFDSVT